jgi:ribosomal protein S5
MRENDCFEINGVRVQRGAHQGRRYSLKYVECVFGNWHWYVAGIGGGFAKTVADAEFEAIETIRERAKERV